MKRIGKESSGAIKRKVEISVHNPKFPKTFMTSESWGIQTASSLSEAREQSHNRLAQRYGLGEPMGTSDIPK